MDQRIQQKIISMLEANELILTRHSGQAGHFGSQMNAFLRATNTKQQLMILENTVKELSKLSKLQVCTDDGEDSKEWNGLIFVICKIYVNSKESTKVAKTILKVLKQLHRLLPSKVQEAFENEVNLVWFEQQRAISYGTLQRVSIMLDECGMMKTFLEKNLTIFMASLSSIMTGFCVDSVDIDVSSCQLATKICLQTIQNCPDVIKQVIWKVTEDKLEGHLVGILQCLLTVIFSTRFSQECCLLAGSAVGLLVNSATSPEDAMATALNLLKLTTEVSPERRLEFGKLVLTFTVADSASNTTFATLVLLKAMLTCLDRELLVADLQLCGKKGRFLYEVLFPEVCKVCKIVKQVQFHSFQVLMLWLQCAKHSLHLVYRDQLHPTRIFAKDSKYTATVLKLVWENWENPIDGVVDCIKTSFSELLEIYREENRLCSVPDNAFYEELSVKLVNTSWHVKGKYGPLCSLISYVGAAKFLTAHPEVATSLVHCLATNYLAPPACEVYKIFLQNLRKECSDSSEEQNAEFWKQYWKSRLLEALCHETQLLRHNASHYWLPWTLKIFPAAHQLLMEELTRPSLTFSPARCLHAQIAVISVARNLKIIDGCDLKMEPICQALWHLDDDIRSDAVGLLCTSHRKSEPLSELECTLLKEFLPLNLNCDSSPFRQHLYACMKRLVVRIRDSCISVLKQHSKEMKRKQATVDEINTPRVLEMSVDFVDWLYELCISSLFPGSCYQRRKTSLELISAILESLITEDSIARRKGQTPDSAAMLLDWAHEHEKWMFFSSRNTNVILSCMEDGTNEIREIAYTVLTTYYPWPLPCRTTQCPKSIACRILKHSHHLLCSPKAMECESGAVMSKMIFQKYVVEMGWKFTMTTQTTGEMTVTVDTACTDGDTRISFIKELQVLLSQQYEAAKQNLLKAATTSPVHGIVLALRRCLTENATNVVMTTDAESDEWRSVIGQIVDMVETIVNTMLQILFGKNANPDSDTSPDFAEMGIAIGQVISDSLGDEGNEQEESAAISTEHQLILAYCWLNIRECSLLLGAFANSLPFTIGNTNGFLTSQQIKKMADIFVKILTKCRHRGAIEGCHLGFMKLCSQLLSSPFQELSNIPKNILHQIFSLLESPQASSSITRRSAGLPLLVEAITSCEPKGREKLLLNYSMEHLLKTVHKPLSGGVTQTLDLPQVHGFNVLKSLFRSSVLGNAMLQYASEVVMVTVQGFLSPSWAIRNACTQLFGTLVARMLGQKRTQDEHSQLNTVTAQEFFVRYPQLHSFLLLQVREASQYQQDNRLCLYPALHPVLTVLSKLGPGIQQDQVECSLTPFIEPVMKLSASPIYAVRVLAAAALLPLVAMEQHGSYLEAILDRLPDSDSEVHSHNALHGMLLQSDRLLQSTLRNRKVKMDAHRVCTKLRSKIWLATSQNPCALTRAFYLDIILKYLTQRHCSSDAEGVSELRSDIKQVIMVENKGKSLSVQIGDAVLARSKVKYSLELIKDESEQKQFLTESLHSEDNEIRLSSLKFIADTYRAKNGHNLSPDFVATHIIDSIATERDHSCLQEKLELLTVISEETDFPWAVLDIPTLSEMLFHLADGDKGTTLAALALPAIAVIAKKNLLQEGNRNLLSDLVVLIEKYSKPTVVEDLRLAVARVLQITGPQLLSMISESKKEELAVFVTRIFNSSVQLLQDEVQEVRMEAAKYTALLHRPSDFVQHPSIHCSAGLELLFISFFECFSWSETVLDFMLTYLHGNNPADQVIGDYIRTSSVNLFEQEDANIYAEHVITAQLTHRHLQKLVSSGNREIYFRKHLSSRLQTAAHRVQITLNVIESSGIKGTGPYGILGASKPFLAVYRLLLYSELLLSMLTRLGFQGQSVMDTAQELSSVLSKFHQIPFSHPLLVDLCPQT